MKDRNSIAFTSGGSGGHVFPGLAVAEELRKAGFACSVWIGSKTGLEKDLVEKAGIPFAAISTGKLRRYFSFRNFTDIFRIIRGFFEARRQLRQSSVSLLISVGGYVSCPAVLAAWTLRIPVVSLAIDISLSLASRLNAPFSRLIAFSYEDTMKRYSKNRRVDVVGGNTAMSATQAVHETSAGSAGSTGSADAGASSGSMNAGASSGNMNAGASSGNMNAGASSGSMNAGASPAAALMKSSMGASSGSMKNESGSKMRARRQVYYSGYPLRREFLNRSHSAGLGGRSSESATYISERYGIRKEQKLLFCVGGSLGAQQINDLVSMLRDRFDNRVAIIHQTGMLASSLQEAAAAPASSAESGEVAAEKLELQKANPKPAQATASSSSCTYVQRGFFYDDYAKILGAADLVLGRAGSGMIWECISIPVPMVLIPLSTKNSRGDQVENALYFAKKEVLINLGTHPSEETVYSTVKKLFYDTESAEHIKNACRSFLLGQGGAKAIAEYIAFWRADIPTQ